MKEIEIMMAMAGGASFEELIALAGGLEEGEGM